MSHSCFISLHINPAHKYFYAATKYFYIFHIQFVLWLYCDACEQSSSGGNLSKKFGSVSISVGWIWLGFWMLLMLLSAAVVLLSTAIVVTLSAHWTRLDRLSWSLFHYGRSWHHSVFWVQARRLMCKCYYCEDSSGTCIMLVECCAVILAINIFAKFQLFFSPPTYARMKYSTREGRLPRLVVSEGRSQPMMSSIRCEARISRTDSEEYKLKLLW